MTVSFVTVLIARTARITCAERHTHTHTHKTTTVILSAHARRGLINTYLAFILALVVKVGYAINYIYSSESFREHGKNTSLRLHQVPCVNFAMITIGGSLQ